MPQSGKKRGREHNAEGARRAILDAAEQVFAQKGFAGARVDEIAAQAGYNKSLLFQYFGDKLKLYTQVLKRAEQESSTLRGQVLAPLFLDESLPSDPQRFKAFLENMIRVNFDFLVEHPRMQRILTWEMADGWTTYAQISAQFAPADLEPVLAVCRKAHEAGVLGADYAPLIQLTIAQPICQIFLAYLPIYQLSFPGEDLSSPVMLAQAREFIVSLIVSGLFRAGTGESSSH
jgi:AcrR family transcriptional regulator